jgi:SAM-dependent methyltransferase
MLGVIARPTKGAWLETTEGKRHPIKGSCSLGRTAVNSGCLRHTRNLFASSSLTPCQNIAASPAAKERIAVGRSRILVANWYDYPQYYDIAFQANTRLETDFIEAACRKYCPFNARRFLEPACGSGRLVIELAARGYQVIGFDLSQPALGYLRRRLARRQLRAETFAAELSNFRLSRPVDTAYCIVNTFRHLLTEQAARAHLKSIARSLRPGGIYILGMDLLPAHTGEREVERWTRKRAKTKVTITQRVLRRDLRRRLEDRRVSLVACCGSKKFRLRHEFQLRTYTETQFRRLLATVPALELCDVYNFWYDMNQPLALNDKISYGVLVLRRGLPAEPACVERTHFMDLI